jgi:hypothetical protein
MVVAEAAMASDPTQNSNQLHSKPATKPATKGKAVQPAPAAKKALQQVHPVPRASTPHTGTTAHGHPSDQAVRPAAHESDARPEMETAKPTPRAARPNRSELLLLQEELHALRTEERAAINNIRITYDPLINSGHLGMAQLNDQRRSLADQKYLAGNSADIEAIRGQYNYLERVLRGEVTRDAALIRRLRSEENGLINRVKRVYGRRIAQLEKDIRAKSH